MSLSRFVRRDSLSRFARQSALTAAALAISTIGCVSEQTLAHNIANAARPSSLPLVVACWEKAFEASDFRAEYVATVSFVVESDTSRIRQARVVSLEPSRDTPPTDTKPFSTCVEDALNQSALPNVTTSDGPGFTHSWDVEITRYRIAFIDASPSRRRIAAQKQANVLLGPRSDRCQGLYTHDPPRDASALYGEVDADEARAARYKDTDPDLHAREVQKAYDAKLELRDRLALDLADPLIPEANKKRQRKALEEAEASVKKTGALIGCSPPARSQP